MVDICHNGVDYDVQRLGGPSCVAELSGRKHRVVRKRRDGDSDSFVFEKRDSDSKAKQKEVNLREKDLFMRGEKMVAIISDAASTGISLHAGWPHSLTQPTYRLTFILNSTLQFARHKHCRYARD